jgi:caspase domain-containing protein
VVGRYRALLIGNSTYPADEHNLQTLKGPVKDIAALNRALADPSMGLFADADVTLLPEATSTRAIRALGRFFGTATRDDVLLIYFSGHGKLDQSGRLHLCMQDTDSADLLSTAVSSARISEFVDASRARNVVIVLDCCYAGAFRGAELGQAMAGPGRYVLTSCRGTQLANDATVENGTSYFTQHLVDGLLGAAADQDGDGYVTFSDLYAYVDRRLREAGKQIPQRRVDGDGDLPLAKRSQAVPAQTAGAIPPTPQTAAAVRQGEPKGQAVDGASPGPAAPSGSAGTAPAAASGGSAGTAPAAAGDGSAGTAPAAGGLRLGSARWKVLLAAAGVVIIGGIIATLVLVLGGSGGNSQASGSGNTSRTSFTANAPWRLKIEDNGYGDGCSLWLIDAQSGTQTHLADSLYVTSTFQISETGTFRWRVNDPRCNVVALPGTGSVNLPFTIDQSGIGNSEVFAAPARVAVHVKDWHGNSSCNFRIYDPANGDELDFATATQGQNDAVTLNPGGRKTAYLALSDCGVNVSAAP